MVNATPYRVGRPVCIFVRPDNGRRQLLKVLIASVLPEGRRNYAFAVFYIGYGAGWLIGSVATGLLYERSVVALVIFAVMVQLVSIPVFVMGSRASGLGTA